MIRNNVWMRRRLPLPVVCLVALWASNALVGSGAVAAERLTTHPAEDRGPDCSPDSRVVVFASNREGTYDLFALDLTDGTVERLTDGAGDEVAPSWSPEGQRLVFHRTPAEGESFAAGLWTLDLHTGEQSLVVAEESAELTPDWSPDGAWVAYNAMRGEQPDLFRVRLDGSDLEQLTSNPQRDLWPRFSPDGASLVFFSRRDTEGEFDELYLLELASGEIRRLTEHPDHHDFVPAWAPDGSAVIAGESRRSENRRELAVIDLDGNVINRLAEGYHRAFHPTFCNDGTLVFAGRKTESERSDLFIVPPQD
jgi:TolB protein